MLDPATTTSTTTTTASTAESRVTTVSMAGQSADIHGALTGILSQSQLAAATATAGARRPGESGSSETVPPPAAWAVGGAGAAGAAAHEISDWTERAAATSAQLIAFNRIDSQRRAELVDQVDHLFSSPYLFWDRATIQRPDLRFIFTSVL